MLVITLGDPHSVTVELLAGLLPDLVRTTQAPVAVVGSAWQWQDQERRLGLRPVAFRPAARLADVAGPGLHFVDLGAASDQVPAETMSPTARGAAAVRPLAALRGLAPGPGGRLAVVTGPIDKHACALAGYAFPGQTEYFEDLWGGRAVMTLAGPRLRVGLVTNHLALRDVPGAVTRELVETKLALLVRTLSEAFLIPRPRVALCGLNPHAGDQGLFGDEEPRVLEPALAAARARFPDATLAGPLPADTAFYRAYQGAFDGVLALYHDQGLGPLKTVHFDDAVNLSGGLPHFRASPDHGPAQDLFLKKQASPRSFAAALALACRYLEGSPS